MVKNPPANAGNRGFLGQEGSLEKEMATHPSLLARKIPRTEEPGGLHAVHGVTRVGGNLPTKQPPLSIY